MQNSKDIEDARARSTINMKATQHFLWGGENAVKRRESIDRILSQDPVFSRARKPFLHRTDAFKRGLAITNRIFELEALHNWTREDVSCAFILVGDALPIGLHLTAFEPVLESQGSPALLEKLSSLVKRRGILGCYLQTELGHGTNVAALETTATFLPDTQEFELHSPTLTSSKWWVGALGRVSTHGVVQARLILPNGKDAGPHLFFVQLRDMENHKLMPGIIAGDVGPKFGYNTVDNGYARFDHVRIPKENMLSKFADVTPDGRYIQPPHAKLSYGGMLYIRAGMVTQGALITAKAVTIAVRYCTVRRQSEKDDQGLERQVITFPSTYSRILPILSRAYVFLLLGRTLQSSFAVHLQHLAKGDTSLLADMHAILSGLKSYATTASVADVETCRRAMGGHGFSAFSGLVSLYSDSLPSVTYEGENYVLDKQVVRAARKAVKHGIGQQQSTFAAFLTLKDPPAISEATWESPEALAGLLGWRAAALVRCDSLDDDAGFERRISKAVTEAFVANQVLDIIEMGKHNGGGPVLTAVYTLFLLSTVESALADFLEFEIFSPRDATAVRRALNTYCLHVLPEAVGLVDAFGFSDWELDSALGVYDGRVYEALWKRVADEPLNQSEDDGIYNDYIQPILKRGRAQAKL
ncbi:peroxisomal oxidase [Cylindrobasidium torrendii FP15055 ss-10]|uniref:Acyl-coenzyme A oxidase n=1 Tax=Cylindrobasidium torrendii FP15055 ss-10 TaxID=1314674 RepID=A0A0D7B2M8_9AGAR|nr:peroxisomal oxidase [Cylindrobasidium torrendii FP15055 ss-10]